MTYKPGRRISFENNPIGQCEEWETDIICEKCGTRYSMITAAYFCLCSGYNSVSTVFDESLDSIEKMLKSIPDMKKMLTASYRRDKAETLCLGLIESYIGNVVSAFQKYDVCNYDKITVKHRE